jgi:hypothetical protein
MVSLAEFVGSDRSFTPVYPDAIQCRAKEEAVGYLSFPAVAR